MGGLRGVELEGWAVRPGQGRFLPVDLAPMMDALNHANGVPITGRIFREPGIGAIEFAGNPADTIEDSVRNVVALHERARSEGISTLFQVRSPFSGTDSLDPQVLKPRYVAIWKAIQQETRGFENPDNWKHILTMNRHAATHMHASFDDMPIREDCIDERIIFTLNMINFLGPRVARVICEKYRVDNKGHLGIFSKWARPERFTRYGMWFSSFDDFRRQFQSIPRLFYCVDGDKESGRWEPDLMTPLRWGDPDDDGSGWWLFARPRVRFGTIEIRILPSLPLECLADALHDLDCFLRFIIEAAPTSPLKASGVEAFMDTSLWNTIREFPIAGQPDSIPLRYTRDHWDRDVFS